MSRYEIITRVGADWFRIEDRGDDALICRTLQAAYDLGRRHQFEFDRETVGRSLDQNDPPEIRS